MPKSHLNNVFPTNIVIACGELVLLQKARTKFFRCFLLASFLILLSAIKVEAQNPPPPTLQICPCGVVIFEGERCPCEIFYPDADNDGHGNPALGVLVGLGGLSTPPAGYITEGGDCDDNNNAITIIRWVMDADNDGFYVGPIIPIVSCTSPGSGFVIKTNQQYGDCNDNDPFNKTILYVNKNAPGTIHDGSSWEKAYTTLQDALLLNTSACITQIWVAAGTYYPDEGGGKTADDREASFSMKNNIAIYGGFSGTETLLSQRNWKLYETILSGAIKPNNGTGDYNAFYSHTVVVANAASGTLDGVTITDGNFDFEDESLIGGGGMRIDVSAPVVTNCVFKNNVAYKGGAMVNILGKPLVTNCSFIGNKAAVGAVLYNTLVQFLPEPGAGNPSGGNTEVGGQATFVNCTFSHNTGSESVGAIYIDEFTVSIVNSILWEGGRIFHGSRSVTYSILPFSFDGDEGNGGVGNLNVFNPGFVDLANDNLRLLSTSPAINAGNDAVNNEPRDLDGNARRMGVIDLGAYEFGSSPPSCIAPPTVLTRNITVQLTPGGSVTITAAQVNNGSFDDCGIETLSLNKSTFLCSDIGPNTVTLTATDANGNTASANATVTVEDHVGPTMLIKNTTVQLTAGGNVTITAAQVDNGSFDACGIQAYSLSKSTFLCSDIGPNTVTLKATDANGNTATANATVTVEDHVAPTMLTKNITVQLTAGGNVMITAAQVDNGSFDACGIQAYSLSKSTFICSNLGANTVTLTATDANGNTATANATVTVEDHVAPTMLTKNITVQLTAGGNVTITAAQVDNGSFDACGIQAYSLSKSTFLCSDIGANTVKLTATDANGNTATANATVTVEDHVAPTMLTKNITVQLTAGGNVTITAAQVDNGSFDACGIQAYSLSKSTFLCSDIGGNTVKLTATDANGNTATANATVTVEDHVAPTMLTKNITVQLTAGGNVTITAAQVDNGSFDACGMQAYSLSKSTFLCSDIGANTVKLTATDANGNTATANATVTVEDHVAPTMLTKNITVQLTAGGNVTITAAQVDNGSFDACGIQAYSLSKSTFLCSDIGANTVKLTATDANGNTATANATVTVEDHVAPTMLTKNITVQLTAGGNVTITAAQVDNGSFDACGIQAYSLSKSTFLCSDIGANTVKLTATDANGNTATANATVTVEDEVAPTMLTKNITVQLTAGGNVTITAAQVDNGSFDACGIQTFSLNKNTFLCSDVGPNTVTLKATDANGNTATANAIVTVEDKIAPIALAKNITAQITQGGDAIITASQVDNGSHDACGGVTLSLNKYTFYCQNIGPNTVTLTATDGSGNTSTATAIVTIEDHVPPTMFTKNITVQLGTTSSATITYTAIDNGSYDACGIVNYSLSKNTFNCSNVGPNPVTLKATDANGNTATASAVVTVEDKIKPVITSCPTVPLQCYNVNGTYAIPALTATDNCGIQSISYVISGATSRNGNGNASGAFNPGTSTITWKVTDVNSNTATCATTVNVDKVNATIADAYASGISSSIGSPNTIYIGYGGSSVTLTAQVTSSLSPNTYVYKWTTGSPAGPGFATTESITVSPSATTTYFVSIKDANGCAPVMQVSKQVQVVDISCGANKITVCQLKNGSYTTTCVSSSPKTINGLPAGSYLGVCVQTITSGKIIPEENIMGNLQVRALPNPSNTNFRITVNSNDLKAPVKLLVTDMLGRVIETRITNAGQTITIGDKYISGTYAVRIIQGHKIKQLTLIKLSD